MHKYSQKHLFSAVIGIVGLFSLLSGCTQDANNTRGYVISQSETSEEPETVLSDEPADLLEIKE